jgi:hypothetical protein
MISQTTRRKKTSAADKRTVPAQAELALAA